MMSIALCAITYRRPEGLRELLTGIAALDTDGLDVDIRVVVVDNDRHGSALPVIDDMRDVLPFRVIAEVEPEQGIPLARNRAVALAEDVDVIGWLDDDEVPRADWLRHLVVAMRSTGADVVLGPSVPQFPADTPAWVQEGGFFHRTRFPTGTRIPAHNARTSGVLIRRDALPPRTRPFNDDLRYTGGSDRELFVEMERAGAHLLWVDEALMLETIPSSRVQLRWILRRAFRIGNSRSTTLVLEGAPLQRRARRAAGGLGRILAGIVAAASAVVRGRGRASVVLGLWECCYGAGLASGAAGRRYEEYRRHHGT